MVMLPMHLSTNTPSTSTGNNARLDARRLALEASARVRAGTISGGTVRCVLPIPVVGSIPMRVKVRPTVSNDNEDSAPYPPRERLFASRPATVAARKKRNPMFIDFAQVVRDKSDKAGGNQE
uniref:KID domain-containing protein n=1 Tax=Panagrellus redivivus TaxID=6233 RepID=A0A7E4VZ38_PANRE